LDLEAVVNTAAISQPEPGYKPHSRKRALQHLQPDRSHASYVMSMFVADSIAANSGNTPLRVVPKTYKSVLL
jgi:hypothetical protein